MKKGTDWLLIEDMATFLIGFGFDPDWVLTRDIVTFQRIYVSAMRCSYIDKSETAIGVGAAAGELTFDRKRAKGRKSPLTSLLARWDNVISAPLPSEQKVKKNDSGKFLSDFASDRLSKRGR